MCLFSPRVTAVDGMADEWAFGHVPVAECLGLRVKETISETAKHLRESTHELRSTLSGKLCLIRQERHMSHLSPRTHHPLSVEMQHGSRNGKQCLCPLTGGDRVDIVPDQIHHRRRAHEVYFA